MPRKKERKHKQNVVCKFGVLVCVCERVNSCEAFKCPEAAMTMTATNKVFSNKIHLKTQNTQTLRRKNSHTPKRFLAQHFFVLFFIQSLSFHLVMTLRSLASTKWSWVENSYDSVAFKTDKSTACFYLWIAKLSICWHIEKLKLLN